MAKINVPLIALNRGIISPKSLARIDLDRTKLSAEVMTNWLPKTQGAMTMRPGTKHKGNSLNDTGVKYIEFVAATDDVALPELTHQKMRVWIDDALLGRPLVDTTVDLSDTGWSDVSTGGALVIPAVDQIPAMTGATTSGVTMIAGATDVPNHPWQAADNKGSTVWASNTLRSVDTGAAWISVDFGSGNTKKIQNLVLKAGNTSSLTDGMPTGFHLQGNDVDTGNGWTNEITVTGQTWATGQKKTFTDTGYTDTGANAWRYWRVLYTGIVDDEEPPAIAEMELIDADAAASHSIFSGGGVTLNATARGAEAKIQKRVIVSDTGSEHSLAINVGRGPVALRVGSTAGDDDYITETSIGTGFHNLAFTPTGNFHITLSTMELVNRVVNSLTIGDSGTVEITTPWKATDLANIRYDQSADVVFVAADGVKTQQIERRGTGRSWSVVEYNSTKGPFTSGKTSDAKLRINRTYGNVKLKSNIPFFKESHVGALFKLTHEGQGDSGEYPLGALDAATDIWKVTGINDTGVPDEQQDRAIEISGSGTYQGTIFVEKSIDGPEGGFHPADIAGGSATNNGDTGTFSRQFRDNDNNVVYFYRARMSAFTDTGSNPGAALVRVTYRGGVKSGICRITQFNSNTECEAEVLQQFADTGPTEDWQEGQWSDLRGYPSAVSLHDGRLALAGRGSLWLSVADDFNNHDATVVGDAAAINKEFSGGAVNNVFYLVSLLRLIAGTSGAEKAIRASSIDEALTPTNISSKDFSTQGSANIRSIPVDNEAFFVQRSLRRIYALSLTDALGDYVTNDLTMLVPDIFESDIVSIAVQRQPDTRVHCAMANGKVVLITYQPQEEVLAFSRWETGDSGQVEEMAALPGQQEDQIYYSIRRNINGATKRFHEKWAKESETTGDTGLTWIVDCAASYTDTGKTTTPSVWQHLVGDEIAIVGNDTGQANSFMKDLSRDTGAAQNLYTVDTGGGVTLPEAVHHSVGGIPYNADWKSSKLAFGETLGTALTKRKRVPKIGLVLYKTHNRGVFYGNDTGKLDTLPKKSDGGATVDPDKIYQTFDRVAIPLAGNKSDTDSRVHIRGKSPRPATVLGVVANMQTDED